MPQTFTNEIRYAAKYLYKSRMKFCLNASGVDDLALFIRVQEIKIIVVIIVTQEYELSNV